MKLTWIVVLLLCFHTGRAQSDYMFFPLSLDRGLSDARVNSVIQDRYGFMWFGTSNGLNRYDGYSIKTFYADKTNGLPANNIYTLFSDSKGLLWIGTSRGVVRFNFITQQFVPVSRKAMPVTAIYCFTEDARGNIYIGAKEGLFCWKPETGDWENISKQLGVPDKLVLVKGLLCLNKDLLFASTEKKGFYQLNMRTWQLDSFGFKIRNSDEGYPSMFGMERLNDYELLVGSLSFGLLRFDRRTGLFSNPKGALQQREGILFNTVNQVRKDHAGRFWVTSNYFRLGEYLPAYDSVILTKPESNSPYGFEDNNANCVYEDRQHNIWIGTALNGLYRFNPNRKRVRFYSEHDFVPGALQSGKVFSIAAMDSNNLMVGTHKGPSIYTRNTNRFVNFKGYACNFGNKALESVTAGLKDKRGMVWIGSSRLGLMRYDPASGAIRVFGRFTKPHPFQDDGISDMLEMKGDSLLVIGYSRPAVFNTRDFTSRSFRHDSITPLYQIRNAVDLCFDHQQKNIWLATGTGELYEYDPERQLLSDRSFRLQGIDRLTAVYSITFDTAGRLWCATNIGALCLETNKTHQVYTIGQASGSFTEIKNILAAGKYIWLTNNRTVARLDPATGRMVILGEQDGFSGVQLYGRSLCMSPWNTVLVGSNSGFYEIFPEYITDDRTSSSACLTAFRVYDKPFATKEMVSTVKDIRLSYRQNFFSFDISAFDYSEANEMEYAYKLEGFDKDWVYIGRQRTGSYTNVPGGDYLLRLKVRNSNGIWNEQGQQIRIHIGKPFWETGWFLALVLLVVGAAIYAIYTYRVGSVRRQARLRSDYEIKLNELENSALRTQMNPHFIFNSLNTINSFINSNERERANQYISKFSRLIRLILDHSREKKILLTNELEVVNLYVQLEQIRFEYKFNYEISIAEGIDTDALEVPPLIIQPFVENAILHGLLPLASGGLLRISVSQNEEHLLLLIEDNGIGRQQARQHKLPAREKHKSHGIDITLKRIELFNKEHHFGGSVTIIDRNDESGKATGTTVQIPLAWEECF
jgi:ligand-binding sensor domain-containing protein/anti-sigma regulatory factor (Ser/Thr protein kinase)